MTRILFLAALLLSLSLANSESIAEDVKLPLTPGMYVIKVTTKSDSSTDTASQTVDVCINRDTLNPEDYMPKTANCTLENVKKNNGKAGFDIDCKGGRDEGVPSMKGSGECGTTESRFVCSFKMSGEIQGNDFNIESVRQGERVGDCP